MFDLCEEKNWKATFEKINVLEKKTSQTEAEGWGGFPFHVWGVRVFFAIFLYPGKLLQTRSDQ